MEGEEESVERWSTPGRGCVGNEADHEPRCDDLGIWDDWEEWIGG